MSITETVARRVFLGRSSWLAENAQRLDASAYAAGGLEARAHIVTGDWSWKRLDWVAQLFVGARFARTYVLEPAHGVPYLTGSDMLLADLKGLLLLSIKRTPQLPQLRIHKDWTLISCSGTIGRTAYVRPDMDAMAASHDVIRVVPDTSRLRPGYLFAYLSSAPAQAMIRQRTYGTVIQHIEPEHIGDIPVPLPEPAMEERIHDLVVGAATARSEATCLLNKVAAHYDALAGSLTSVHDHARAIGTVSSSALGFRLDAFTHLGWAAEARNCDGDAIGELAEVIGTNRVPRIYVERGVPFASGIDVFRIRPPVRVRLAKFVADRCEAYLKAGDLAVQGSGQRYGLLGQAAFVGARLHNWAASHDLFRIRAGSEATTARIFAFLRSDAGHRMMLRHSYGTSIPHVNPDGIRLVRVPPLPKALACDAVRALQLREQADADEERAIQEVETWLG